MTLALVPLEPTTEQEQWLDVESDSIECQQYYDEFLLCLRFEPGVSELELELVQIKLLLSLFLERLPQ